MKAKKVQQNQQLTRIIESWLDSNQYFSFLSHESIWIKFQKTILSRELVWINSCKVIVSHELSRIKTFWDWAESNKKWVVAMSGSGVPLYSVSMFIRWASTFSWISCVYARKRLLYWAAFSSTCTNINDSKHIKQQNGCDVRLLFCTHFQSIGGRTLRLSTVFWGESSNYSMVNRQIKNAHTLLVFSFGII